MYYIYYIYPLQFQHIRNYVPLLRPRQTKYRKFHLRLRAIKPFKPDKVSPPPLHFHQYGIYALESVRLTAAQIESARLTLVRTIGRKDTAVKLQVFPHIPVTKKPIGVRMGKGKGTVDHFIAFVKAGKMIVEYSCNDYAKQAYKAVSYKLPIKVGFVSKE